MHSKRTKTKARPKKSEHSSLTTVYTLAFFDVCETLSPVRRVENSLFRKSKAFAKHRIHHGSAKHELKAYVVMYVLHSCSNEYLH